MFPFQNYQQQSDSAHQQQQQQQDYNRQEYPSQRNQQDMYGFYPPSETAPILRELRHLSRRLELVLREVQRANSARCRSERHFHAARGRRRTPSPSRSARNRRHQRRPRSRSPENRSGIREGRSQDRRFLGHVESHSDLTLRMGRRADASDKDEPRFTAESPNLDESD